MITLLIALSTPGLAQDDEEFGFGDLDIDLDDIDLGEGSDGPSTMNYTGGHSERSEALSENAAVTITHYGGSISVRCTDSEEISARMDFNLEGTSETNLKAVGDGIRLQAQGKDTWGKVSTIVPGKRSGISTMDVPLSVSVPKNVRLTVNGRSSWIAISGCTGTVKAVTSAEGITADGTFSQFDLRAGAGDVSLDLGTDSSITKTSGITASKGNASLVMPLTVDVRLQATGGEVSVLHTVTGTNNATNVSGTVGDGGPLVKVYGKERVEVTSP
ncbi:MAG: hypothetical protein GY913_25390 [Proteobacteria bacterium]|nr:hypothetical protein [Pseudomonadota bacterium]MCP4920248.1 hypothetical protein [Pseudomonadota bacterium]